MSQLLKDIEMFMAVRGMNATQFGKQALNNPAFVFRLRQGMDIRSSTAQRVRNFMLAYDEPVA